MLSKLLICFSGIFISYIVNGYAIEYLTTTFGKKIFTFYLVMILSPSLCNACFGMVLLTHSKENKDQHDPVPRRFYFLCSFFQMASMIFANAALAYIAYPTQLVMKSSKPIFILAAGLLCMKKGIHHPSRILSTLIIVFGVTGFMYQQYLNKLNKTSSNTESDVHGESIFGWSLVCISLFFDALLGFTQDWARCKHTLNTNRMIYNINVYSSLLLIAGILFTNEIQPFIVFFQGNPSVVICLFLIGITGAIGQGFIFYTIAMFGPLTCSIITNVRKFFQIFLSVFMFSHVVTIHMFFFVCVVFSGLMLDVWSQFRFKPAPKSSSCPV